MKNEFKEVLNDMHILISDLHRKYRFEQVEWMELKKQLNEIAMLAPQGTFEGERKMKTHKIKLFLNFCDDVLSGDKTFEIRENDRGYQKGDRVVFEPYNPSDPFVKHPISDKVVYGDKIGYPAFDLNAHDFDCNGLAELSENGGQWFYEVIGNIHDNPELLEV